MGLLARTCLPFAIVFGLMMPATADAASRPSICKSKKRSKKKKAVKKRSTKKTAKAPAKRKVTAVTIAKWQKQKMPADQIVEKATAAGYVVTRAEKKKLLRHKVKKPLIAKLEAAQQEGAAPVLADAAPAAKEPLRFDPNATMDPNDIDFDSVPPPKGMPTDLARKQKEEARKPAPAAAPAKSDDNGKKRVVIAAGK